MFLGLDCGGSTTRALALDEAESVVFEGRSGAANWASTPRDELRAHLREALAGAPAVKAVCGCFAGLLTREDAAQAEALLREVTGCQRTEARPDFHAAYVACPPETTICVISGTGSLVCSEHKGGMVKSGGGGPWFGDHGSAFGIVRTAIGELVKRAGSNAVSAIIDQRGKTSEFYQRLLAHYDAEDLSEAVSKIYERRESASVLARFADSIVKDYESDSPYAEYAISSEMDQLADTISWHLRAYHRNEKEPTVALVGGLWEISEVLEEQFLLPSLEMKLSGYSPVLFHPKYPPVTGAARLAMKLK